MPNDDPGRGILPRAAAVLLVLGALASLVAFGRLRPAHPGRPRDGDFVYSYAAGAAWRRGLDPYDFTTYKRVAESDAGETVYCNFAYAPTAAGLVMPLGRMTPDGARRAFVVWNVAAALAVGLALAAAAAPRLAPGRWRPLVLAGVAALAIGAPAVVHNLYHGQTTLICLAFVVLALWADESGRPALAGALLGAASFKISLPAFAIGLVFLERRWRVIGGMAAAGVLLASYPLWHEGPIGLARAWLGAMRLYREFPQNNPDYPTSFGLAGPLDGLGLPYGWLPLGALGLFAWLYLRRRVAEPLERLGVALALPLLFVSAHLYDVAGLLPLCVAGLLATRRSRPGLVLAAGLVTLLLLPPSGWTRLGVFHGAREGVALLLLGLVVACVERRARSGARACAEAPA